MEFRKNEGNAKIMSREQEVADGEGLSCTTRVSQLNQECSHTAEFESKKTI